MSTSCILVEHAGAARRQLTFLREPVTDAAFSADPNRGGLVYFSDPDGKGNAQLYYQRAGDPVRNCSRTANP